ncbi:MAG TPA: alpha-glucan family phosphorylase [Candidatus Saccharimonadia bacterium]
MQASASSPKRPVVAYFSAEYAIADDLPIYAGGLGILAADIVMQAAAGNREFWAVGLVYHEAFTGDDPDQRPMVERLSANGFELATGPDGQRMVISLDVAGREVKLQAWLKRWDQTRLLLLDARLPDNTPEDQQISDHLYASAPDLAFAQEICLGFGGVAMLRALGGEPDVYHLNEGHAALAGLAVVLHQRATHQQASFDEAVAAVRGRLVATKHTLLSGAGLFLDWTTVGQLLAPTLAAAGAQLDDLMPLAGRERGDYSDTKLLMQLCERQSGVSKLHVEMERREHPDSRLVPITNGIFRWRWTTAAWDQNPLSYDDAKLWAAHCENRHQLLEHVREQTGKQLDPETLTVVWSRRMAAYKRPELLVTDPERLGRLLNNAERPIQLVVAGQANPADAGAIALMTRVIEASRRPDLAPRFAYLPHYNPITAKFLVRGADLWLNTPIRGYEACGTSGMKASLNGALQLSTSDGWIDEIDLASIGWRLPDEGGEAVAHDLYNLLGQDVAHLFYDRANGLPTAWVVKMRANIRLVLEQFTAERMLAEYYAKLYEHG